MTIVADEGIVKEASVDIPVHHYPMYRHGLEADLAKAAKLTKSIFHGYGSYYFYIMLEGTDLKDLAKDCKGHPNYRSAISFIDDETSEHEIAEAVGVLHREGKHIELERNTGSGDHIFSCYYAGSETKFLRVHIWTVA